MFRNSIQQGETGESLWTGYKSPLIASRYKITASWEKTEKYLKDGRIYPVTLELDLTSSCNRDCPDCPSTRASENDSLSPEFVNRLFRVLENRTEGLLLTGGETTLSPLFPETLKSAREKGFREIAVVTNGSRLDDPAVYNALTEHASTIRISMYDRKDLLCEGSGNTLERISRLRKRIEDSGSGLEIGVSVLTRSEDVNMLEPVVKDIYSAGAHWAYFHPFCSNWDTGSPEIVDQSGVESEIKRLRDKFRGRVDIFYPGERYTREKIEFDGYHGSHFLMVVGADGKNYLGAETKYDPSMVIADLNKDLSEGFLWKDKRIDRIMNVKSHSFKALRSRHRGSLYSSLIDDMIRGEKTDILSLWKDGSFKFPYIL